MLIRALPRGSRTRSGLVEEWPEEREFLATLVEAYSTVHSKKGKGVTIPRPRADELMAHKTRVAAVDRMIAFARRVGGGR